MRKKIKKLFFEKKDYGNGDKFYRHTNEDILEYIDNLDDDLEKAYYILHIIELARKNTND